ncbi:hypothetical protein BFS35_005110 [Macrococcoides goetzii]|uniref:Asparagine synthetase domain-containing protein n=1 Tax=Macrococcoides goetzii TaxID=1891097 RepID=A0A2G5NMD8_9STAP|nr:hypothetical protein [Macrococcus goetzii]RAI83072.1 hypothetical protein BFS35_005110 [Macrococcus goetzii]
MSDYLIHKAFLITKETIKNEHLQENYRLDGGYQLYTSKDLRVSSYETKNGSVYLLGYAFDISIPNITPFEILNRVLYEKLSASSHSINHLNGSFVIVKSTADGIEIFSDAAGFRSPYYTSDLSIVSSHDKLIGDIFGNKKITSRTNILDHSRYEDVFKLVPSVKLTIGQAKVRIYPNPALKHHRYQEILSEMKKHIKHLNLSLNKVNNKLLVGITGGIDSKCTLALTKPLTKPVHTFTYMKDIYSIQEKRARQIYKNDKVIVNRLTKNINLDHEMIEFNLNDVDKEFSRNMFEITGTTFNHPIAEIFEEKYKKEEEDVLQFRSVIFSNAKYDYPKAYLEKEMSIKDIYEYFHNKMLKEESYDNAVKAADDYFDRTLTNIDTDDYIELLDIIHIDSRMGNWHSQLIKETDRVMDFFNYLNDRQTLNLLLHLPVEVRRNHLFHKDLIDTYWPILNFFEENGTDTLYSLERNDIMQNIASDAGILNEVNIDFDLDEDMYALIPKVDLNDTASLIYKAEVKRKFPSTLLSFYNNEKGRNYIKVHIKHNEQTDIIDIVDLSKGYPIYPEQKYEIEIKYQKPTATASWIKAGTVYIK